MRIRKRQVPLPLSSLSQSQVPLSDPQRSLLVQLQNTTTTNDALSPQSTDHPPPLPIGDPTNVNTNKDGLELLKGVLGGEEDDGREKVNESTTRGIICSSRPALPLVESSSTTSLQGQVSRWPGDMGEKAFPLKKRRGSFEKKSSAASSTSDIVAEKDRKIPSSSSSKARATKTDMNKKYVNGESDVVEVVKIVDDDDNDEETKEGDYHSAVAKLTTSNNGVAKNNKRNRGGTLMEGSRCSRVNGRGWRCCQQTLVGYSLCEHHLGKGRLRSMTSVRSRSKTMSNNNHQPHNPKQPLLSSNNPGMSSKSSESRDDGEGDNNEGEKKNAAMMTKNDKKRMKLGVVKARSMSSLLGQGHTCNATNVAYVNDINNNNDEEDLKELVKREVESENVVY